MSLDPNDVEGMLTEWSGDALGRFALGDESVTQQDLDEATAVLWISSRDTFEGVFSPDHHRIVDLFVTP
jgi:hypothetical protein